jgi:hypothetical protein
MVTGFEPDGGTFASVLAKAASSLKIALAQTTVEIANRQPTMQAMRRECIRKIYTPVTSIPKYFSEFTPTHVCQAL